MKKSILSTLFLIGLFIFAVIPLNPNTILAQEETGREETSGVEVKSVEIKDVKITAQDDKLEISAVLFNPSQNIETAPFTYSVFLQTINSLIKQEQDNLILPPMHVAAKEGEEYFQLKPKEAKSINVLLPLSLYLPKSNYEFYLKLIKSDGKEFDSYRKVIYDLGVNAELSNFYKESFLAFDQESCVLITPDGKKYEANAGPIFRPMESPQASCLIKNVSGKEVKVYPVVEWKEFFVFGRPSSGTAKTEKINQIIAFKSGETKTVEVSLPKTDKPQVYQALLNFSDKNDNIVSYAMSFRWTIGGPSARIDKIIIDKNSLKRTYKKGDAISLSIDYFGSMDLFWGKSGAPLSDVKISANIKDDKGNVCGTNEAKAADVTDPGLHNQIVSVVLNNDCKNISYEAFLFSAGQKLASEADNLPKLIGADDKEKSGAVPLSYYIIGVFILIAAYKIITAINRKKHKNDWQKNLMILLIISAAAVFLGWSGTAQAAAINTLTVRIDGSGSVTSVPAGISCDPDCSEDYADGTSITLTAQEIPGWYFVKWINNNNAGACGGSTAKTCVLNMTNNKKITAKFLPYYILAVAPNDSALGTIQTCFRASGVLSDCQTGFLRAFRQNQNITIIATPIDGYYVGLDSWSLQGGLGSGCDDGKDYNSITGDGQCKATMNKDKIIKVNFSLGPEVNIQKIGNGAGNGSVAGCILNGAMEINCSNVFPRNFPLEAKVILKATVDEPYRVTSINGMCNIDEIYKRDGDGVCKLTTNQDKTIEFKFADKALVTTIVKTGQGKITSEPVGIGCGSDCEEEYSFDSNIELRAIPGLNYNFASWTGSGCEIDDIDCWTNPIINIILRRDKKVHVSFSETKEYGGAAYNSGYGGRSNTESDILKSWYQQGDGQPDVNTLTIIHKGDYSINADFSDLNNPYVWFKYRQYAVGCMNSPSMKYKIKIATGADTKPEKWVGLRAQGGGGLFSDPDTDNGSLVFAGYGNNSGEFEKAVDIDPNSISNFYNSPLAPNPYLAIYITELGVDQETKTTYFTRGYFTDEDQVDYKYETKAFAASDVIKYKIPLALPARLPSPNNPPVLSSIGNQTVNENQLLTINVSATDADGDPLTYSTSNRPSGSGFNPATRMFSWTPSFIQGGPPLSPYSGIRFTVDDGKGGTDSEDITIKVNNVNRSPVIGAVGLQHTLDITPPTTSHTHNGATASDLDGDPLTYTWSWASASPCPGAPPCPSLINSTGSVTGGSISGPTYTPDEAGNYNLQLSVSDGIAPAVTKLLTEITNTAPVIGAVGPQHTLTVGNEHIHSGALASDPDGDPMTYIWSWAPVNPCPGVLPCPALTSNTGSVSGDLIIGPTYTPDEAGTYNLQLSVTDAVNTPVTAILSETAPAPAASNWWDLFNNIWREQK